MIVTDSPKPAESELHSASNRNDAEQLKRAFATAQQLDAPYILEQMSGSHTPAILRTLTLSLTTMSRVLSMGVHLLYGGSAAGGTQASSPGGSTPNCLRAAVTFKAKRVSSWCFGAVPPMRGRTA